MRNLLVTIGLLAGTLLAGALTSSCGPDCRQIQEDGRALVSANGQCKAGDECVMVNLEAQVARNCSGAFACSAAFNKNADLAAFSKQARELEDRYRDCRQCAQAECAIPAKTATCNVATGLCEPR